MTDALFWHRLQFGFTVTYHYLFPQLTMGLALVIVILQWKAWRDSDDRYSRAALFWGKIFALNFALGVVTGIPMEFQFGTNWARFSRLTGSVIGQTLAMEGMFAFFLESSVLGLFLYGGKRLAPAGRFATAALLFLGSWLSGYFIIATNAFMQHPVGHSVSSDGTFQLEAFWTFLLNPWALWEYAHNMTASITTAAFVVAAVGAGYLLIERHREQAELDLRIGVTLGVIACLLQLFPTGDRQGKLLAEYQPVTLAAMEGLFETGPNAPLALIGQPDLTTRTLQNPIVVPGVLSFLAYGTFGTTVHGLSEVPRQNWPDNVELLYYAYHVMVGIGTALIVTMALAALALWRGFLFRSRSLLWILLLAWPFPYIATTAGWMTAELGRQPWLVYGLLRTSAGSSAQVTSGDALFTLIGFCGLYLVLGVLFLALVGRELAHGPDEHAAASSAALSPEVA